MKPDQISAEVTPEAMTLALGFINSLEKTFTFLISLTPEERQGGLKAGDINVGFLSKTQDYLKQNPQFMPPYKDVPEALKDFNVVTNFPVILKNLRVVFEKFEDTFTQAGFEALLSALVYYDSVQRAAHNNEPGAQTIYDDLKKRFPGRPKLKTAPK